MMRNSIPCIGIIRIRCKGFDLSLSFIPLSRERHPYWYRRQKYSFFRNDNNIQHQIFNLKETSDKKSCFLYLSEGMRLRNSYVNVRSRNSFFVSFVCSFVEVWMM